MVAFLEAGLWRQTAKASSFTGSTGPSKGSHWPDTIAHSGRFWKCKGPQCFSTLLISTGHRETTACEAPSIRFKEMETFKPENWQGRIVATCLQLPGHWEVHESMAARSKAYRDVIRVPKSPRTPEGRAQSSATMERARSSLSLVSFSRSRCSSEWPG